MNDKEQLIEFERHKDECRFASACRKLGSGFTSICCTSLPNFIETLKYFLFSFENINRIENLSKHYIGYNGKTFNQDIFSNMHYAEKEHLTIILVEDNDNVVEHKTVSIGDSTFTGMDSTKNTLNYLKEKSAHKFVMVHNHPWSVCAVPSNGDIKYIKEVIKLAANEGFELVDFCVFTMYDFWSYKQCVEEGGLNSLIKKLEENKIKCKNVSHYLKTHKAEISEDYTKLVDEGKELYEKFKEID